MITDTEVDHFRFQNHEITRQRDGLSVVFSLSDGTKLAEQKVIKGPHGASIVGRSDFSRFDALQSQNLTRLSADVTRQFGMHFIEQENKTFVKVGHEENAAVLAL